MKRAWQACVSESARLRWLSLAALNISDPRSRTVTHDPDRKHDRAPVLAARDS